MWTRESRRGACHGFALTHEPLMRRPQNIRKGSARITRWRSVPDVLEKPFCGDTSANPCRIRPIVDQ